VVGDAVGVRRHWELVCEDPLKRPLGTWAGDNDLPAVVPNAVAVGPDARMRAGRG